MFDRFGEMSSAAEINELADNLLNEGDIESIRILAAENGIDAEYVTLFLEGDIEGLCDIQTAALGKIDIEAKDMKVEDLMADWVDYLRCQVMENDILAAKVRRTDKSLKGMIGALLQWSFKHQHPVSQEIMKEAGVTAGRCTFGIPGMGTAKKIIMDYYMGGSSDEQT